MSPKGKAEICSAVCTVYVDGNSGGWVDARRRYEISALHPFKRQLADASNVAGRLRHRLKIPRTQINHNRLFAYQRPRLTISI